MQPTDPTIPELIARDPDLAFIAGRRQRVRHATLSFAAPEAVVLGWWFVKRGFVEGVHYRFERRKSANSRNDQAGQLYLFDDDETQKSENAEMVQHGK
ncbi:MAG: hypothetical protein GY778_13505 [bacterium]|nr:hypothetical protein [bacterium]